jgi:hypothetical protein
MRVPLYILYLACLLLSLIMAIANRRFLKSRRLLLFIPFLSLLFLQELGVFLYKEFFFPGKPTGVVYNISRPVLVSFYALFFYLIPVNAPVRKLIAWMLAVYLTVVAITFLFIQSIRVYNSYLSLASAFVISCCGILFLFNYFNIDSTEESKKWRPVVWITTGLVIFYPVVNIVFAFYKYIQAVEAAILGAMLYNAIPQIMSIFMYGCFIYAFYLCKKKN